MEHNTPLISIIALGLGLSYIFGMIAHRLRLSPIIGYLFAGVLLGPHIPFVYNADLVLASEIAEVGVMLLMFGVGLHFSLGDLKQVKNIAIPGALLQIGGTIAFVVVAGMLLGYGRFESIIFGLCLSVASTVVLLKQLEQFNIMETPRGKIAIGWLVVEDLITVLILVILPALQFIVNGSSFSVGELGYELLITFLKLGAFTLVMFWGGKKLIPEAISRSAATGLRELFTLSVLAIALGIAYISVTVFNVSFALGAFFAGMILHESELSHRAAEDTLPLRDTFAVLFFVAVGMLFDFRILLSQPINVLLTTLVIVGVKSLFAYLILRVLKKSNRTAITISVSLAQIGEFSFILAGLSTQLGYLTTTQKDLILAGAIISIVINPFLFNVMESYFIKRDAKQKQLEKEAHQALKAKQRKEKLAAGQEVTKVDQSSIKVDTTLNKEVLTSTSNQLEAQVTQVNMDGEASDLTSSQIAVTEVDKDSKQVTASLSSLSMPSATGPVSSSAIDKFQQQDLQAQQETMLASYSDQEVSSQLATQVKQGVLSSIEQSASSQSSVQAINSQSIDTTSEQVMEVQKADQAKSLVADKHLATDKIHSEIASQTLTSEASVDNLVDQDVDELEDDLVVNPINHIQGASSVIPLSEEELNDLIESDSVFKNEQIHMVNHTIVVGFSAIGKLLVKQLQANSLPVVVITHSHNEMHELNRLGINTIFGKINDISNYYSANINMASRLVFTLENAFEVGYAVDEIREEFDELFTANKLQTTAIAIYEDEVDFLKSHQVDHIISLREVAAAILFDACQTKHEIITDLCDSFSIDKGIKAQDFDPDMHTEGEL